MTEDEMILVIRERINKALIRVGAIGVAHLRQTISDPYPPASEPRTPPHMRSGTLRESVKSEVDGLTLTFSAFAIRKDAPYMRWLEFGTPGGQMIRRPYMRPHRMWEKKNFRSQLIAAMKGQG